MAERIDPPQESSLSGLLTEKKGPIRHLKVSTQGINIHIRGTAFTLEEQHSHLETAFTPVCRRS